MILGDIFFRISELEAGTNCYERKQDIQQWPPSPKKKKKCSMVNKLHPVVLQSRPINYIRLEKKTYFMNCKVQLNMVAWQTDWGTLSWLSERGNCGAWERSSASDRASECACASASSTQSQQFARHFCESNVNCKVKYDFSTNEARNNCNTSFPCDFDWEIHFWYFFHDSSRSKVKFQSETRNMCRPNTSFS